MNTQSYEAAARLVAAASSHLLARSAPILVALDGPSGSGKSTLAQAVAALVGAVIVPSDDFFAADLTAGEWDTRGAEERARDAIDWRRMRREALVPLLAGRAARWRGFDFAPGGRPDGTWGLAEQWAEREPGPVILLEGAYASRPELDDLIALSVLVDAPANVRAARLAAREEAAFLREWHARWDDAEAHYFTHVRPRSSFDLVVSTAIDLA